MIIGTAEQVKEKIMRTVDQYLADKVTIIPNFYGANNRMVGVALLAEAFGLYQ